MCNIHIIVMAKEIQPTDLSKEEIQPTCQKQWQGPWGHCNILNSMEMALYFLLLGRISLVWSQLYVGA